MVIFKSEKNVFWQAFVLTIIVFGLGVFFGFWLENSRTSKISEFYAASELELLDARISQSLLFGDFLDNKNCDIAIQENINFADRIYSEAKILDRYESASRITESIKLQHKKYDLLRTLFWINSIEIKERCNASYHNVVYFYKYNNLNLEEKAKNNIFSRILGDIKEEKGNKIMLIPIAGDNNISSINFLMGIYDIKELPTILIDERIKITKINTKEEIKKFLD